MNVKKCTSFDNHSSLYEFIFEACEYFSNVGFYCDSAEVFQLIEASGRLCNKDIDVGMFLKTNLIHSEEQAQIFDAVYEDFKQAYFYEQNKYDEIRKKKEDYETKKEKLKKQLESYEVHRSQLMQKLDEQKDTKEAKKAKETEERQERIANLKECISDLKYLQNFTQIVTNGEKPDSKELIEEIKTASKRACTKPNAVELLKAIQERGRQLKAIKGNGSELNKQIKQTENNMSHTQNQIAMEEAKFQKRLEEIVKQQSISHRKVFEKAKSYRSVKSNSVGEISLDKSFKKMSGKEKIKIFEYIKENARKFRTRLTKKIRTDKAHKLDVPATIKKSCQTGGIPLRLMYKKPEKQKANLILILDVSGSCKDAAEMMLVFMHAMKEVFPGGCRTYAFTNQLYDITSFFDTDNPDKAAKEILNAIPRAGAYSNYEKPFRTFYNEHMSEVTGDSYVYFIGDARNNKNESGKDFVKAIARKAKEAFWLNTEEIELWDTGDSIMSTYAKYMTKVAQTVTPAELLGFLEN